MQKNLSIQVPKFKLGYNDKEKQNIFIPRTIGQSEHHHQAESLSYALMQEPAPITYARTGS